MVKIDPLVGQRLAQRRKKLGLDQQQLAEKSNLKKKYIADIEAGKINPRVHTLAIIAVALNMELLELIQGEKYDR